MALIQNNILLEKENHALRKELLEQKMMLLDYKNISEAQLEEAKNKEERLIKDNEEFKEMKVQAEAQKAQMEETQRMMQKMMEMMMQKQANPYITHHFRLLFALIILSILCTLLHVSLTSCLNDLCF